jgi:peptidoglycan hydrolase-like protein with peptidoglycan-binding domain
VASSLRYAPRRRGGPSRRGVAWAILGLIVAIVVAIAAAAILWSAATLAPDSSALARIKLQPFAGKLVSATAAGPNGQPIALVRRAGRLTPRELLTPGETVSVDVVVRRPGWLGWALGKERRERLTIHAPVAHVMNRWVSAAPGEPPRIMFDIPVDAVALGSAKRHPASGRFLTLPASAPAGATRVAAAARNWERVGAPVRVSWFPPAHGPVALATPAPGSEVAPATPLRLTFSKPVDEALGSEMPKLHPATPGRWRRVDSHTLAFEPTGFGARMGGALSVTLPHRLAIATATGRGLRETDRIAWPVRPASTLRLHQLLAQAGYLPVTWTSTGADVARTPAGEAEAAVNPPKGTFGWRYSNTPSELRRQWKPDRVSDITRGAVMSFQDTHHLTVDSIAGPSVWNALLKDAIAQKRRGSGYSYVYVHRNVPQLMTLWHNGHVVIRSPGNTGVPSAPTQLGTFPVFEHIAVGTMSGTNPDGSSYHDPGIKWISYFHGGEALHAFPRASFGTPQSLGCVELPEAAAQKVWPYTPIGTLVTIEN